MPEDIGKTPIQDKNFGAIDVAALMAQITLNKPENPVTVKGLVEVVQPSKYRPTVWGILQGFDKQSSISFQCSIENAPSHKEYVILRGTLKPKPSTSHAGIALELIGDKIGEWTPSNTTNLQPIIPARKGHKLSLERLLSGNLTRGLICIGTKTGIEDLELTLSRDFNGPFRTVQCTTGFDNLKAIITDNAPQCDGLCLLRGGGDEYLFAIWNDIRLIEILTECGKPFYTALGHSSNYTLTDKYADESFGSPSDFGSACTSAWNARKKLENLQSRVDFLNRENKKLKEESESTKQDELKRRMGLLETAISKLPAILEKQIGFFISTAVKTSIENSFSQPTKTVVERSIANLNQAADSARNSATKLTKVSRLHSWTWLLSIFLLGALTGSFGYHYIAQSKVDSMQEQLRIIRQQTAVTSSAPESIPPDGKLTKGHRGR